MIFVVIPFGKDPDALSSERTSEVISEQPPLPLARWLNEDTSMAYEKHRIHGQFVYFVKFLGTTRELAELLGFRKEGKVRGIVIPMTNYAGLASPDLWEWFDQHDER
ncbi:MAG: hypothetical protein OXI35_04280 [Gemmatimonadota bacterium]|nr:hypothetical protein [Gemmatimonadota bacterium]